MPLRYQMQLLQRVNVLPDQKRMTLTMLQLSVHLVSSSHLILPPTLIVVFGHKRTRARAIHSTRKHVLLFLHGMCLAAAAS